MRSPTGKGIRRLDKWGTGKYGASRGDKRHEGTDYVVSPGQDIVAPIEGIIIRKARPYRKGKYSGVLLEGKHMSIKMFYSLKIMLVQIVNFPMKNLSLEISASIHLGALALHVKD